MSRLAPLAEVPGAGEELRNNCSKKCRTWRQWLKTHLSSLHLFFPGRKSDHRMLLSVLGCPLSPLPFHPKPPLSHVSSSSEYIIQHFMAATGCRKLEGMVKNMYTTGKVFMAVVDELGSPGTTTNVSQKGCFVMWQMLPSKWLIELALGGHKIVAGSDGNVAWRHTPWLGAHAAKGGVRPLRRALQGLDPMAISAVFSKAEYMGEKHILGVDCFVLKLSSSRTDLVERSDNTAEMIKHVMLGYFSQRSGLLIYLEDSYLTRIQSPGSLATYWETAMCTRIEDYRPAEGVMVAHSGYSSVIITTFGDHLKPGPVTVRMQETYTIDDLAFNVPGLSVDSFIPPEELQRGCLDENVHWRCPLRQ
ncbi:unnamed protein product [Cuscuta epithymum]|uniref:Uncharacterized protein n=1 Tax=Cuscuta epithymum TaxID=186058 RepID=A0AAV0DG46_9ASTE|nr:unnamed protein product [Cuscuta epithymum]